MSLSDELVDAMEGALRDCLTVLCECAPSALDTTRELSDAELGKMWIAVSKQADAVLKAIDKERTSDKP